MATGEDYIALKGMRFRAFHGVHDFEKKDGNDFVVDAWFWSGLEKSGKSGQLTDTLDYSVAYGLISDTMSGPSVDLLETLSEKMAEKLSIKFPECKKIRIRIKKLNPPLPGPCKSSEISRVWYLAS